MNNTIGNILDHKSLFENPENPAVTDKFGYALGQTLLQQVCEDLFKANVDSEKITSIMGELAIDIATMAEYLVEARHRSRTNDYWCHQRMRLIDVIIHVCVHGRTGFNRLAYEFVNYEGDRTRVFKAECITPLVDVEELSLETHPEHWYYQPGIADPYVGHGIKWHRICSKGAAERMSVWEELSGLPIPDHVQMKFGE